MFQKVELFKAQFITIVSEVDNKAFNRLDNGHILETENFRNLVGHSSQIWGNGIREETKMCLFLHKL